MFECTLVKSIVVADFNKKYSNFFRLMSLDFGVLALPLNCLNEVSIIEIHDENGFQKMLMIMTLRYLCKLVLSDTKNRSSRKGADKISDI